MGVVVGGGGGGGVELVEHMYMSRGRLVISLSYHLCISQCSFYTCVWYGECICM